MKDYLLKQRLVSKEVLDQYVNIANQNNKSFEEIIIENNIVREEKYLEIYGKIHDCEVIDLRTCSLDPTIVELMPDKISEKYNSIVYFVENKVLHVAMQDPMDLNAKDDIAIVTGYKVKASYGLPFRIKEAFKNNYVTEDNLDEMKDMIKQIENEEESSGEMLGEDVQKMTVDSDTPVVVKVVNQIIVQAVQRRASDIHIEPFPTHVRIRYRIDGNMVEISKSIQKKYLSSIISRIKVMAGIDIAERRKPQDGKISLTVAKKRIEIRVATSNTILGEEVTMRLIDMSKKFANLEETGFSPYVCETLDYLIQRPYGLIIVSGPTGSGKTSTLYTLLDKVNKPDKNILTVEDPVERQVDGLRQHQVSKIVSFNDYLESFLRLDPDVIMVGEIRDRETATTAVNAALTGHLVIATLHANNAPATITRLVEMGVPSYYVSGSILATIGQRLIRRVCPHCKEEYTLASDEIEFLKQNSDIDHTKYKFYKAKGCQACEGIGYQGRIAVGELLMANTQIRELLVKGASDIEIGKTAVETAGMELLLQDAINKLTEGLTTLDEVRKVAFSI